MAACTSSTMYRTLTICSGLLITPPEKTHARPGADGGQQEPDARVQLGRHPLERRIGILVTAAERSRIGNAPVHMLGAAGELRAHLPHPVAQRDHVIKAL